MELRRIIDERVSQGRKILSPYLCAGFPEPGATVPVMKALADAGADCMELGVPFSDPVADGPTIQSAAQQALRNGTSLESVLDAASRFREGRDTPVILMSYTNPILKMGAAAFISRCVDAGVAAVIVPDLPPEASRDLGLDSGPPLIPLVAPNTPGSRVGALARREPPFLYCVSVLGVTGAREGVARQAAGFMKKVKEVAGGVPALAGFGVSSPLDAVDLSRVVDGVIVGSALLKAIKARAKAVSPEDAAYSFLAPFRRALDEGAGMREV